MTTNMTTNMTTKEEMINFFIEGLKESFVSKYEEINNSKDIVNNYMKELNFQYEYNYNEFCSDFIKFSITKLEQIDIDEIIQLDINVIIYDVSIDLGANSLEISTSSAYIVKFVNCTILVSSTYYISISSSTPSLQILGCHFIVTGNTAVVIHMNCGEYSFVSNCTFNVTGDPANIITVSSGYGPRITNNNIRYHTSNNTTAVIISTTSSMTTINGNYIFGGVGVSGTMTAIYCNGSLSVIIGNCIAIGTSGTTVGIRLDTSSSVCIAQGNGITSDTDVSDSGTNNQGTANTATHNT